MDVMTYESASDAKPGLVSQARMKKAQNLMDLATEHGAVTKPVSRRYHEWVEMGIDSADALHLACAESAGATLLTTDDTIIRIIKRYRNQTGAGIPGILVARRRRTYLQVVSILSGRSTRDLQIFHTPNKQNY